MGSLAGSWNNSGKDMALQNYVQIMTLRVEPCFICLGSVPVSGSKLEVTLPAPLFSPRGHLAVSRDVFVCHS